MGNILGFAAITDWGTFTGNGGGATFNIPHGVTITDLTKVFCIVQPASTNAAHNGGVALTFHRTIDATNIVVTYNAVTPAGTGNIVLDWMVGRKHTVREEIYAVTRDTIPDE